MPQTPSAISNRFVQTGKPDGCEGPVPASEDQAKTFASLLGGRRAPKSTPVSKKHPLAGAKTKDDLTSRSDDANATSAGISSVRASSPGKHLIAASMPLYIPGAQHGSGNRNANCGG